MFASFIRWICIHPHWYTVLTGVPYLAAIYTPSTPAVLIVVAWTAVRVAMIPPARRKQLSEIRQSQLSKQEYTLDRIIEGLTVAHQDTP